ncbi:MAG: hypothetical protein M1448_02140 [Candidatus Marsarchaeota archaeon]|nr:hypothetical protein [Candidatus Marsarchaeota archaeon]
MYIEGRARIGRYGNSFLNPHAKVSRDISVAAALSILRGRKSSKLLDSTAATGIRGIRYALEAGAKEVTLLEINETAYKDAVRNVKSNNADVTLFNESIQGFANRTSEHFDIIDLDPFGSAAPNIFDLLKVSRDGTYLFVTSTDTAVLCGASAMACKRIYDSVPMHNEFCKEVGMRILIGYVAKTAFQFGFGISPVLSLSYMHYMRSLIRLDHGVANVHGSMSEMGYAHFCESCMFRSCEKGYLPKLFRCPSCGGAMRTAGRMWCGNLKNNGFIDGMLGENGWLSGESLDALERIRKEADLPLYYSIPHMTKKLAIGSVSPNEVSECLKLKGWEVSGTHFEDSALRTDADSRTVAGCIKRIRRRMDKGRRGKLIIS